MHDGKGYRFLGKLLDPRYIVSYWLCYCNVMGSPTISERLVAIPRGHFLIPNRNVRSRSRPRRRATNRLPRCAPDV